MFPRLLRSAVSLPLASVTVAITALTLSVFGQNGSSLEEVLAAHPQAIWLVLVAVLVHALVQLVQGVRGRREREGTEEYRRVLLEIAEQFKDLRETIERIDARRDQMTRNAINEVVERLKGRR